MSAPISGFVPRPEEGRDEVERLASPAPSSTWTSAGTPIAELKVDRVFVG